MFFHMLVLEIEYFDALVVVPVTIMIKKNGIPGGYMISVEMLSYVTVSPIQAVI